MSPSALGPLSNTVTSLARAFAREIQHLPTRYLREFYKIKVKDDIEALPNPRSPNFRVKYKRVSRELRKLEAANNGNSAAYQHVLSLAYGRKGKLKWELLEPLLSDPCASLPPPIISAVESSRPPVYSPEVVALLGSTLSRNGSAERTAKQLQHPPILPKRADPGSDDAKILGPFSKRREVNLRWKFFKDETAKVHPPIEASRVHAIQEVMSPGERAKTDTTEGTSTGNTGEPAPQPVGFQGTSVLRDLEAIASPNPNIPKRAIYPKFPDPAGDTPSTSANRFIRRQHRKILSKIPVLTYSKHPNSPTGKYEVSLSPLAHSDALPRLSSAVPMADEADLAWLRLPPPQEPQVKTGPKGKVEPAGEGKPKADQSSPGEIPRLQMEPGAPGPGQNIKPRPGAERPEMEDVICRSEPSSSRGMGTSQFARPGGGDVSP